MILDLHPLVPEQLDGRHHCIAVLVGPLLKLRNRVLDHRSPLSSRQLPEQLDHDSGS
jgi:hypothetical protein